METFESLTLTFVLNVLWQLPLLAGVAFLAERLLGRAPAKWHYGTWSTILVMCLSLAITKPLLRPYASSPRVSAPESAAPLVDDTPGDLLDWMASGPQQAVVPPALTLALLAWFGVASLVALGRLTAAAWRTRSLARSARRVELPPAVTAAALRWRETFDLGPVDILVAPDLPGPVTLGWRRPRILVPSSFLEASAAEIDAVLGHEMAHVRHRDYPVHLVVETLSVPLAFHPVLRFVRRRLALHREMACDEAVVESGIDARSYTRSLLALARTMVPSPPIHTLGVFDANTLEARMKRMLDRRPRPGTGSTFLRMAATSLIVAIVYSGAGLFAIAGTTGSGGKALVGTWTGWFEAKPGQRVKAIDLTVREAGEHPQISATLYRVRYHDGKAEAVAEPTAIVASRFEGDKLVFRTRADNFRVGEDGPAEKVEIEWAVELTGKDTAALHAGWNSKFSPAKERGEDVPPPPPPLPLQRVH